MDFLKDLMKDDTYIAKEFKCLITDSFCNPEFSQVIREVLMQALSNDCADCTNKQKEIYDIIMPVFNNQKWISRMEEVKNRWSLHNSEKGSTKETESSKPKRHIECINDICSDSCEPGYFGNPLNFTCQPCSCNGHATDCDSQTGKCFCSTRGIIGDHCDKCDEHSLYEGDPKNGGTCYYELAVNYQFTFEFHEKRNRYHNAINYKATPTDPNLDTKLSISCSEEAKMNVTVKDIDNDEKSMFVNVPCSSLTFEHTFSKKLYNFGNENNNGLTTIYVYVYDLHAPVKVQVAISQLRDSR
ncbi:hypothetical protein QAD02_016581 [Eretmocerus hayati]|uniref:Uncharacterized protein n=1 Tax=Eretmocerus hayati TaxID=131215 RepID=A0ACC2PE02_9HYME|nr:hypothetical protein QAD02_016581 [Eretmocerus hayati]